MTKQHSYERQLLGRIIADRDAYYQNADIIHEDLFLVYRPVYDAYQRIIKKGKKPTLTALVPECKEFDLVDMVKHVDYSVTVDDLVEELDELNNVRMIDEGCIRVASMPDSETKLKTLSDVMTGITKKQRVAMRSVYEIGKEMLEELTTPVSIEMDTGFRYINYLIGGCQRSDLFIVAAETSQGKTSLALNIAENVADSGVPAAVISLEMSEKQLLSRLVSSSTGIEKRNFTNASNYSFIENAISSYKQKPLQMIDAKSSSIVHIIGLIRAAVIRSKVGLVVIDYIQLVSDKSHKVREQEIGSIARTLKNLAKELDICIIALSQLSRDKQNPYPTMARLRDSGQIEEAADVIMFIYRPEFYGHEEYEGESAEGLAEIVIAKGRNYGTGKFKCQFDEKITKFYDRAYRAGAGNDTSSARMEAGNSPF